MNCKSCALTTLIPLNVVMTSSFVRPAIWAGPDWTIFVTIAPSLDFNPNFVTVSSGTSSIDKPSEAWAPSLSFRRFLAIDLAYDAGIAYAIPVLPAFALLSCCKTEYPCCSILSVFSLFVFSLPGWFSFDLAFSLSFSF